MLRTVKRFAMPMSPRIPTELEVQARLSRWVHYFVDKMGKTAVAEQTGLSLAHVSNLYNHPDVNRPSLKVVIGMCFGLDVSLREMFREDPPRLPGAEQPPRLATTKTKVR
jgi:hypothetical protein